MSTAALARDLEAALATIPLLDAHTHMDAAHLAARGLADIQLYHMVVSDLYSAGCPDGARLSEDPTDAETTARLERAIPYLPRTRNTFLAWGVRLILADLYDWREPVTADNWQRLDARIRERASDAAWPRAILRRAGIQRTCTELWRGRDGQHDDLLQYSLEWAFFTRNQWGQFDAPLYELECTWSAERPLPPLPVTLGGQRAPAARPVRTLADVEAALDHYVAAIPFDRVLNSAQHFSTDIAYRGVTAAEMRTALRRRDQAGPVERDTYANYLIEGFMQRLEARPHPLQYQFSLGAEPLPFETASRINQETLAELAALIARHPKLSFLCHVSSLHANQTLCSMARELPNLALVGYWWHNFFPEFIRQTIRTRLDMLPVNRQVGFISDAYCADWAYAKVMLVRKQLALVLADKIEQGQYDRELALATARAILFDTPRDLCGMVPVAGA